MCSTLYSWLSAFHPSRLETDHTQYMSSCFLASAMPHIWYEAIDPQEYTTHTQDSKEHTQKYKKLKIYQIPTLTA